MTLMLDNTASSELEGLVLASRYLAPAPMQITAPRAGIQKEPAADAEHVDDLLFGEAFDVLEMHDGVAFGQSLRDGYTGWVEADALGDPGPPPTHRVSALTTLAFNEPAIKTAVVHRLFLNSPIFIEARDGRFAKVHGSGWVVEHHLSPIGQFEDDPAAVAARFLGVPYLWGGGGADGLDCSGLVQQALYACGRACPRNSGVQAQALGEPLDIGADLSGLARNDLVFWPGHVGIMLDETRLLHANATAMCVSVEPLAEAVERIQATGSGSPSAFRRL